MVGFCILIIFLTAALLMFLRKLPAILALPLMALAIALVEVVAGKLTLDEVGYAVVADGSLRLAEPIVISMIGGMVSLLMQKAGVADRFVRVGAELAGDDPWTVSLITLALVAVLFTTVGGLGAVIMVGTIVLPILASLGLRDYVAGAVVLFGISLGGLVNPNNWAMFTSVLGLEVGTVSSFALQTFLVVGAAAVVFVTVELRLAGRIRLDRGTAASVATGAALLVAAGILVHGALSYFGTAPCVAALRLLVGGFLAAATGCALVQGVGTWRRRTAVVHWPAYLIPLVPLALILLFSMPFVPAFLLGFAYGVLSTLRRGSLNMTSRAVIEGSQSVVPAVVLMLGIGMLLNAILGPSRTGPARRWYEPKPVGIELALAADGDVTSAVATTSPAPPAAPDGTRVWPVAKDMEPLLAFAVPTSAWQFVGIFALLAPLALYRGPLNVWGLGYGVGTVLMSMGVPAGAVMGILMSVGTVQGVSDPTNTQNVWVANEVRVDVNTLMWRTLPFTWGAAVVGLLVAGLRFY